PTTHIYARSLHDALPISTFVVATAVSGMLLNGSFVVLAVRGQESMPNSLGMVSGLMLGLSIGLGGLAVAPMAIVAERAGIPPVLDRKSTRLNSSHRTISY